MTALDSARILRTIFRALGVAKLTHTFKGTFILASILTMVLLVLLDRNEFSRDGSKGLFGVTSECRTPSAECRMEDRDGGPGLPTGAASVIELTSKYVVRCIGSILHK